MYTRYDNAKAIGISVARIDKILITGGMGMLGLSTLHTEALEKYDKFVHLCPKEQTNLLKLEDVESLFESFRPTHVIHLATYSGNLQFNQKYPADTFYNTVQMGLNVLTAAKKYKVKKILSVLSSCAIADRGEEELQEDDLHKGPPNSSIESHGYAKRVLDIYSRQLNKQYGLNAVCAIVNNSFGPYDSFSPEKTKVIGAMIKRFVDAKDKGLEFVECWGSGIAKREFIYCDDVAKFLLLALEKYNDSSKPINIGSPDEISIKELAETTAKLVGYEGEIRWLKEKGDGQLRKKLDLTRMNEVFGECKYTKFEDGLKKTIEWYLKNKDIWTK